MTQSSFLRLISNTETTAAAFSNFKNYYSRVFIQSKMENSMRSIRKHSVSLLVPRFIRVPTNKGAFLISKFKRIFFFRGSRLNVRLLYCLIYANCVRKFWEISFCLRIPVLRQTIHGKGIKLIEKFFGNIKILRWTVFVVYTQTDYKELNNGVSGKKKYHSYIYYNVFSNKVE